MQYGTQDGGRASEQGMTLLETIMAVMILGIYVAGAVAVINAGIKVGDQARDHYVAINIGKNRFERARTAAETAYGALLSMAETGTYVNALGEECSLAEARFQRITEVNTSLGGAMVPALSSTTNLVEFVVTVKVKDRQRLVFSNEIEVVRTVFTKYY